MLINTIPIWPALNSLKTEKINEGIYIHYHIGYYLLLVTIGKIIYLEKIVPKIFIKITSFYVENETFFFFI